ncbi:MAG: tetratricopeptide repeat protein [Verrucomicrobia bacterium]|nr:tetratricopeptide repeat protein [Verrucomicrobiota bacterium]
MRARPENSPPSFFREGCLIVLPLLALAAVGLYSLFQDKRIAEQEAREHAQRIADRLSARIWEELPFLAAAQTHPTSLFQKAVPQDVRCAFQVDEDCHLRLPPPHSGVPSPRPFDPAQLSIDQSRRWMTALAAGHAEQSGPAAVEAWQRFLATFPPEDFAASAHYALGLALLNQGQLKQAREMFELILTNYPNATLESGLPLRPLAEIRRLELAFRGGDERLNASAFLQGLCSNLVYRPTPLTPQLLRIVREFETGSQATQSVALQWESIWADHEQARALYEAARRNWLTGLDEVALRRRILATRQSVGKKVQELLERTGATNVWIQTRNFQHTEVPLCFWIDADESWLGRRFDFSSPDLVIICLREQEVRRRVNHLLSQPNEIPDFFQVGVELAGRTLRAVTDVIAPLAVAAAAPARPHQELAFAQVGDDRMRMEGAPKAANLSSPASSSAVKVNVYLTNPGLLYARQRQRTLWFGALVGAASAAAFAGFVAARRAFFRQLHLHEMKTNFVSSVSHELRAPLASIRLMTEGLESGRIKEEAKRLEYFSFIGQECRRLSSLIENVLDFSRIEQGRKQYEFEPTDLPALLRQTLEIMKPPAAERAVILGLVLPNPQLSTLNPPPALDGRAIQQALVNLIDNAIKHSPKGSSVTVGLDVSATLVSDSRFTDYASRSDAPRSTVPQMSIWVEDRGDGIPPQEHERIFERFYRLGSELRRETPGVGIGLSIVKHIVEAHGGRVLVQSAVGQGSRFTIELPVNSHPDH